MRARQLLARLEGDPDGGWTSARLAVAIEDLVRGGRLSAGVDLPSERDLAVAIGRSRGTVARAYERLRDAGLAHTRHGAGTTIGCCAGPWASSRAADLVSLEPLTLAEAPPEQRPTADLRSGRWAPHLRIRPEAARAVNLSIDHDEQLVGLARRASGAGVRIAAEQLCWTAGRLRAVDVAVATLVQPGGTILVPERTDPRVLALLRVRGFRLIGLPIDRTGRPDVPAWLTRIRARRARAALLGASHAGPHGAVLAAHERHLLAEALADADVALAEDVTDAELWVEQPPPPPLATFGPGIQERTLLLGEVSASDPPGSVAWLHTADAALADRMRTACRALDGSPSAPVRAAAARAALADGGLAERRRRHLVTQTAALIRLVTPAVPDVSLRAAAGGATRWLAVGGLPGSVVADALQERDVLVTPGAHWTVGGDADPAAVTVSLAGSTGELVAGIRSLTEVVAELR